MKDLEALHPRSLRRRTTKLSKASIEPLTQQLHEAKTAATKGLRVSQDHPDPDRHLLALWNRRLRLLAAYRKRGKPRHTKRRLRKIQNEIKHYTSDLASEQWMQNCGHTHLSKMWGTLRSLLGQRKTMNGAAGVALRENISTAELAEKAADIFFPQTSIPTQHTYAKDDTKDNDNAIDSPFCMAELDHALQHANARKHAGGSGVPQGSVIAPTLFNIAVSQLPERLAKILNIEHAIYADDVSEWTHTGCLGKQEEALQVALNTIHAYSIKVGLATAPDKTEFVVVHGGRHTKAKEVDKDSISLSIGEQPIARKVSIRLLGMFIDEKCTTNSWYNRTVTTTKQVRHILRRISNRTRGVKEQELCQFVTSFIHAKVMYGLPYHPVTRTQLQALECLNHEARRITTGLPRYTPLAALKSCSGINDLTGLLETHLHTQEVRLRSMHAGRNTLAMLGHDITNLPDLPQLSPPWEHIMLTDSTPAATAYAPRANRMKTNLCQETYQADPDRLPGRRYPHRCPQDGTDFATAWVETTTSTQGQPYHATTEPVHSTQAEMHAIVDYVRLANDSSNNSNTKTHFHPLTDSQAAHRACADVRHTTVAVQQLRLSVQRLCALGDDLTIYWVPGHSGIPGNEKAHQPRTRALTICAGQSKIRRYSLPSSRRSRVPCTATRPSGRDIRGTALPQSLPLGYLPIPSLHPSLLLNSSLTGSLLRSAKFRAETSSPLTCYSGSVSTAAATAKRAVMLLPPTSLVHVHCAIKALIWSTCFGTARYTPSLEPAPWLPSCRVSGLPRCMHAWACPDPSFFKVTAIELWRSLLAYIQDHAAPPVGTRLQGIQLSTTEQTKHQA
ncbi:hypothetical protein HPB47_011220 [Ixodes persulcatus]|uniref:Uncharacterized protein n=1 Tax=Ixodes persulcatus TaxID=34615 RepID=A0AC60NWV8_IXOPE|nr:hypothetical protein HPB47_011220 [Ixodes persulcatus]